MSLSKNIIYIIGFMVIARNQSFVLANYDNDDTTSRWCQADLSLLSMNKTEKLLTLGWQPLNLEPCADTSKNFIAALNNCHLLMAVNPERKIKPVNLEQSSRFFKGLCQNHQPATALTIYADKHSNLDNVTMSLIETCLLNQTSFKIYCDEYAAMTRDKIIHGLVVLTTAIAAVCCIVSCLIQRSSERSYKQDTELQPVLNNLVPDINSTY